MAAAKKHSRNGRKSHKNSFFCFFGSCFGNSNKVSADHGDGKSVKNGSSNSGRHGRTLPQVNDHKIRMSSSSEIVNSSREIHVVEDEEKRSQILASPADELINNKAHDITSEKSKNKDESNLVTCSMKRADKQNCIAQETLANPTALSQSVSLPLQCQRKEKTTAAAGDEKGKKGREIKVAGEFDSMVGAVIITVTLIVMLIWGKVCAILCTAAWFYFIPRFRANMDEYYAIKLQNGENHIDLDSREYKKKVVLQGLLDRNQHL